MVPSEMVSCNDGNIETLHVQIRKYLYLRPVYILFFFFLINLLHSRILFVGLSSHPFFSHFFGSKKSLSEQSDGSTMVTPCPFRHGGCRRGRGHARGRRDGRLAEGHGSPSDDVQLERMFKVLQFCSSKRFAYWYFSLFISFMFVSFFFSKQLLQTIRTFCWGWRLDEV